MTAILQSLQVPIVQAPMAGGPSTIALAAAVDRAGGLGCLAAGYLSAERMSQDIADAKPQIKRFGVNVFVGGGTPADPRLVRDYAAKLQPDAEIAGVQLGEPQFNDDAFAEKIDALLENPVALVSFTFGIPPQPAIDALHEAGSEVWLTVTSEHEAKLAAAANADALVVQGVEAGGHRGVFVDDDAQSQLALLAALQLIGGTTDLPLIAAGSITTGAALAAVLACGAAAGQLGTAYLLSDEAGTSEAQRISTKADTPTALTRVYSGRTARGIRNAWHERHKDEAPSAYPEVHYLTSPLRAHGRKAGDADLINLWAGEAHPLAPTGPAEEITRRIAADAASALRQATARLTK
jgi:nitronate monooxygenase